VKNRQRTDSFAHAKARILQALAFSLFFFFLAASPARAQVFELNGGTSSLYDATGGSVGFRTSHYAGHVDFGIFGSQLRYGFYFAEPFRNYTLGLGDQPVRFVLPTDLFNNSYYFLGRGASMERKGPLSHVFFFAGATSTNFYVPFLSVAQPNTPTGLFFYERRLSPKWRFVSQNIASRRQTSIQAVEWQPKQDLKMAMSAGLGNNEHYWASSFELARKWISLDASYAMAGDAFRRVVVDTPILTELNRENVRLELSPARFLHFTASRQNYISPISAEPSAPELRAAVNSFGAWGTAAGFQLYGTLFDSQSQGRQSESIAMGARRNITRRFEAGMDYLRSGVPAAPPLHSEIFTFRELLTQRITVSQVVTEGGGQRSISFGGEFLSNWVTVGADYQTVYFPLAPTPESQFHQVLRLSLHVQLPVGIQLNGGTQVTPTGQVKYTASALAFAYHGLSGEEGRMGRVEGFFKYVVRGRVVDEAGNPVSGAALLIDKEMVLTDSRGDFFLRLKKAEVYSFEVSLGDFMVPGRFQVVSAPPNVKAEGEQIAEPYRVVLKRLPILTPPPAPAARPAPAPKPEVTTKPGREDLVSTVAPRTTEESCLRMEQLCGVELGLISTDKTKYFTDRTLGLFPIGTALALEAHAGKNANGLSLSTIDLCGGDLWVLCPGSIRARPVEVASSERRADRENAGNSRSAVDAPASAPEPGITGNERGDRSAAKPVALRSGRNRHSRVQAGRHHRRRRRAHRAEHRRHVARRVRHRVPSQARHDRNTSARKIRSAARRPKANRRVARRRSGSATATSTRVARRRHRTVGSL
jgi:hypothetical protein